MTAERAAQMVADERSNGHGSARTTYPALVTVSPTAPESPDPSAEGLAAAAPAAAVGPSAVSRAATTALTTSTATSSRVAAAEQRAGERRDSQSRRLRLLLWPVTALVILPTLLSRPRPGLHGHGLVVTVCVAAFAVAVLVTWLWVSVDRPRTWYELLLPLTMGAAGIGLVSAQNGTSGQIAVSVGVVFAFLRQTLPRALGTGGVLTA